MGDRVVVEGELAGDQVQAQLGDLPDRRIGDLVAEPPVAGFPAVGIERGGERRGRRS
ncbi:MAG: hypothetical protein ACRDTC_09085 [Pseudonocardiaceae bacterium]